jgi:hypothetical protein
MLLQPHARRMIKWPQICKTEVVMHNKRRYGLWISSCAHYAIDLREAMIFLIVLLSYL